MSQPSPVISIEDLTIRYGPVVAVDGVRLGIRSGDVLGFVGPNGAGKTSTIRALLDLVRPQRGHARLFGIDVEKGGVALRARVGFLPGDLVLFDHLTGIETLRFFERLRGQSAVDRDEILDRLGFPRTSLDRKVRGYSTGMRQAIGITTAFQHGPEVLILDEPTAGLDPIVRDAFKDLIRDRAAAGTTVLLSSHVLAEVEDVATTIALIHHGRIVLHEAMTTLRDRLPRHVTLHYSDGQTEAFSHSGSAVELLDRIERAGLIDIEIRRADLRDVFRSVILDENAS